MREELKALLDDTWLVWSNEHAAWWGPNRCGYYSDVDSAGRYSLEEAQRLCRSRSQSAGQNPTELIQPSPELLEAYPAARAALAAEGEGEQVATAAWAKTLPEAVSRLRAVEFFFGDGCSVIVADDEVWIDRSGLDEGLTVSGTPMTRRRFRALLVGLGITERVEEGGE